MEIVKRNTGEISKEDYNVVFSQLSEKTTYDYVYYFKKFIEYTFSSFPEEPEELKKIVQNVNQMDILKYILHLKNNNLKSNSINTILSALKHYFNNSKEQGLIDKSPVTGIKKLKVEKDFERITRITATDIKKIITKLNEKNSIKSRRNALILCMLYYTGLRANELLNLRFENIITNRDNEKMLKLTTTKSQVSQYVPLHSAALKVLNEYKDYISKFRISKNEDPIIFGTEFTEPMSYKCLWKIIKGYSDIIDKPLHPHLIRHTTATELALKGASLEEIKELLRHSNVKTTSVYMDAKELISKTALNKLPEL